MNAAIKLKNIGKSFAPQGFSFKKRPPTPALIDITLSIPKGRCVGLLGPNGAGKTTLLKIMSTLIIPDKGNVFIEGFSPDCDDDRIKERVGLLLNDERSFYWRLTGRNNLLFFASMYGFTKSRAQKRINDLFRAFKVDYADRRFDSYSTGMKRKFALMRALLHDPPVLLLDEPTKSLDLNSGRELRNLVKGLADRDKTTVLASHDMAEAEELCDFFVFLSEGAIRASGTLDELRERTGKSSAGLTELYMEITGHA